MAKTFTLLIALALLVMSMPARAQDDDFPRTVIDMSGRAVTIPAQPTIIAMTADDDPILARLLPADQIRRVDASAVDWEGVDLLVISEGDAAAYPALIAGAASVGVPIYRTTPITSLESWRRAVIGLGRATGRDLEAEQMVTRLDRRLEMIQNRVQGLPPTRVLILTPEGYTFGQDTLITALLEAVGGINVAAQAGYDDYRQITDEDVRGLAPEVILLSPTWGSTTPFTENAAFADMPAVQQGRVFLLPFSPTHPRDPAAAALGLAIALHPAAMLYPAAMLGQRSNG